MANTVASISQEIVEELGSPDSISAASVATWLRTNLGRLNMLLDTCYEINVDSQEIDPELGETEKAIFKELYFIKYYERMINTNLALAASKTIVAISDEGSSVKFLSGNDIAKSFKEQKRDSEAALKDAIFAYKLNLAVPLQVTGNDHIEDI